MNENLWPLALSPVLLAWLALVALVASLEHALPGNWTGSLRRKLSLPLLPFALALGGVRFAAMMIGAMLYLVVGAFSHPHLSLWDRVAGGLVNGYLFGWLWSIGIGVVACVIWEHQRQKRGRPPLTFGPSSVTPTKFQ